MSIRRYYDGNFAHNASLIEFLVVTVPRVFRYIRQNVPLPRAVYVNGEELRPGRHGRLIAVLSYVKRSQRRPAAARGGSRFNWNSFLIRDQPHSRPPVVSYRTRECGPRKLYVI